MRRKPTLIDVAESFLELARDEANEGFSKRDTRRVRDAAEKAWLAANQATDHLMAHHGQIPEPGPCAHTTRHDFLEAIGRGDLSKELGYFADRLHGDCFYRGACPTEDGMHLALEEVGQFIRKLKAGT